MMLLAVVLPWVELRPNRLAAGELVALGHEGIVAATLVLAIAVTVRRPVACLFTANAALLGGVLLFGREAAQAVEGLGPIARAGAAPGVWLWLLGAGVALWSAAFAARGHPRSWAKALPWLWLPLVAAFALSGGLTSWSVWQEGQAESERLVQEALTHVGLVVSALGAALLIGVPLAIGAARNERLATVVLGVASGIQTMPSLALLGLLITPLAALANAVPVLRSLGVSGIGAAPALVALTLYALLPIIANGVLALRGVSPAAMDAALGMGMNTSQQFLRVQLPLALPVWLAGLRQATVVLIGVTSIAALIGAGGLGVYVFRGLNSAAPDLILLGAIPACLLALAADGAWRLLEGLLSRRFGGTP